VLAQEALLRLGLDRVLLVPAAVPPHKAVAEEPGAAVRAELCELAVAGDPRLAVSLVELERGGTSYTVDTLRALRAAAPGDELTLILGADMAASLPAWREPEAVLALARVAVAQRAGTGREAVLDALGGLAGGGDAVFFDMPLIEISSSAIRARLGAGEAVRYLVPDAVAARIGELGLYRHG